jgi:hypothetical protein
MAAVIIEGQQHGMIDASVNAEITADLIVAAFERPLYSLLVLGWEEEYQEDSLADLMARLLGSERLG